MNTTQSAPSLRKQTKVRREASTASLVESPPLTTISAETVGATSESLSLARREIRWRWGVLAAVALALLSLYPQLDLWITRGEDYQGSYTSLCYDEEEYASYIQGLLLGRPRRHEPYGATDPSKPQYETFLSLQIVPAYLITSLARLSGLTAVQFFILLTPLAAFAATLMVFYLLASVTGEEALAAVGALTVLILGTLAARHSAINQFFGRLWYGNFPFLRRYQPAATFPLFFVFITLIWQAFTAQAQRAWRAAIGAGVVFSLLVFSYFFLWTSAVAWLACFVLLWLAARRTEWRLVLKQLAPTALLGGVTLAVYGVMLTHRDPVTDEVQMLNFTHAPDFYRAPQIIAVLALLLLIWGWRKGYLSWREPLAILAGSLALMPFAVFNQQIITGRSLQPVHYEMFSANYVSLLSVIIGLVMMWRGRAGESGRGVPQALLTGLACLVLGWGAFEMYAVAPMFKGRNLSRDEFMPVAKRLTQLAAEHSKGPNEREMIFSPDIAMISDSIPAFAPQVPFWSTDLPYASGLSIKEQRERYFQFLYYSCVQPTTLIGMLANNDLVTVSATFGFERYNPDLTKDFKPITTNEILGKVQEYSDFVASFDRERARRPELSYVVVYTKSSFDFTNLDRWYVRGKGEQIGPFTLYQVKLR